MPQNILVVDDDEKHLEILSLLLAEGEGHKVFVVSSAIQAITLLERKAKEIDLIISDVNMPQMCGIELTKFVKQFYPDIPVILCSGRDYQQEAKDLGAEFIGKPYQFNALSKIISDIYPPT